MTDKIVIQVNRPSASAVATISDNAGNIETVASSIGQVRAVGDDLTGANHISIVSADLAGPNNIGQVVAMEDDIAAVAELAISGGLDFAGEVSTYDELRSLARPGGWQLFTAGGTRGGTFEWISGDQSALVAKDYVTSSVSGDGGIYVTPDNNTDRTGTNGCWRRIYDGLPQAEWWGLESALENASFTGAHTTINAALDSLSRLLNASGTDPFTLAMKPSTYHLYGKIILPSFARIVAPGVEFRKVYNGDMVEMGPYTQIESLNFDGRGTASQTGRGVLIQDGNDQRIINCDLRDMDGYCVEYLGESIGVRSQIEGGLIQRTNADLPAIKWPYDTGTGDRKILNVETGGGWLVDARGIDNGIVHGCNLKNLITDGATKKLILNGNRIATVGEDLDLRGTQCAVLGNIIAGALNLKAPLVATITGATQANPVVITATAHGHADGDHVTISSVGGMTELNNNIYRVVYIDADSFSLKDPETGVDVDGTGFTAYTSGGIAQNNGYQNGDIGQNVMANGNLIVEENDYGTNNIDQWGGPRQFKGSGTDPCLYLGDGVSNYQGLGMIDASGNFGMELMIDGAGIYYEGKANRHHIIRNSGSAIAEFRDTFEWLHKGSAVVIDNLGHHVFKTAAATDIADQVNAINTSGKAQGRAVFDTTNNRLMIASGAGATAAWYAADGSTSVTPA